MASHILHTSAMKCMKGRILGVARLGRRRPCGWLAMREALETRMLSGSGRLAQEYHRRERLSELEEKQTHAPWHRAGADIPPVEKFGNGSPLLKGMLTSFPSFILS